ncbi:HAD family hydrolase [Sulfobacillus harzensis]|uniref:HAD family hydrolase n=1 Tax=Sulfobacillus harzensis TaxID=2729629 RepID=A0A7Y0L625_9FIRM|nr:HAD family hydrolase [Sulfobacillus harzensis]NMP23890.1 HAD family hydrolase [Sulfobacillus harzensis]
MAAIKCIVLDLDGTLLNRDQTISPRTLRAVDACWAHGISIVLATGRPPRDVRHLLVTEALREFVIYLDGALTIHESDGLVYDHRTIPPSVSSRITQSVLSADPRSIISFEVQDAWYCLESQIADEVINADSPYPPPHTVDEVQIQALSPTKIILSGNANWERVLRPFDPYVQIRATPDGALIQVMEKSVSKESALSRVLNALGVDPEVVMVFGDGPNDMGLFGLCGYPVAMGNAVDALKGRAKYITDSNEDDGVAAALQYLGVIP